MRDGRAVVPALLHRDSDRVGTPAITMRDDSIFIRSGYSPNKFLDESSADPQRGHQGACHSNAVYATISFDTGELQATVSLTSPEHLFYVEDARGCVLSNDFRLAMHWAKSPFNPSAVFALFQFSMVPAPLTLYRNILRVPPGHVLKARPGREAPTILPLPGPILGGNRERPGPASESLFLRTLDAQLAQLPERPVLYFSGGVDSTLIASRLAGIGRQDTTLMNLAFGPNDEEGQLALRIASHLGLRCEQVMFDQAAALSVLERAGRDYTFPFGDCSTIPTNVLVHASMGALGSGRVVIEGTGGDGGFGPIIRSLRRWQRFYALPRPARHLLGESYEKLSLWQVDIGSPSFRFLTSLARLSEVMALELAAVVADNALDGIAYTVPPEIREELAQAVKHPIRLWGEALSANEQLCLLDLIHVCAARFASKSFDPLRQLGSRPLYPFLEPPLLDVSFRLPWEEKMCNGEAKPLLKRLVARGVPPALVYRPKSGFAPPMRAILAQPSVAEFCRDVVLVSTNPLLGFLDSDIVRQMIDASRRSQPLDARVYNFLWVVAFTSAWLNQQPCLNSFSLPS
jgi:asparagine synthase (glutamine-hydrolysing)